MKFFSFFVLIAPMACEGFQFFAIDDAIPGLSNIIDAQSVKRLSINLNLGKEGCNSRMAIHDFVVDLKKDPPNYEHVAMPGFNGPMPKVSSGIRRLDVVEGGHFISLQGTENIKTSKSCWEVNWKKDAKAGALICGMEIDEEYRRNDATLAKGRVYLSFPVWNKESLANAREQKAYVMKKAEDALKEKEEEIAKYHGTNNLLMKALHYRNIYAAAESYMMLPVNKMETVPEEHEVIALQDDLLLTTKGLIWSKVLPVGKHQLLGSATISIDETE